MYRRARTAKSAESRTARNPERRRRRKHKHRPEIEWLSPQWSGDVRPCGHAQTAGMTHRNFRVLAAAEKMVVEVVALFEEPRPARRRLLFKAQTLDCAESVPANIGEAF